MFPSHVQQHGACNRWPCALGACLLLLSMLAACEREGEANLPKLTGLSPVGIASAQQTDLVVPPAAISGAIAPVDEAFALFAASNGLAEIEGARLVLKSSKRSDVRDYAQKLVRDHEKSMQELRRIVAPRGLKLPPGPTGRHADMVTKLTGVDASERDEAFLLRFGADAHKEAIALYERHATEGKEPELRRHAQQMLPMLREHMSAAQTLIHAAAGAR